MDALALLCTLYADGPSTLHRLRGGGCESLSALLEVEPEILRERMGWNERIAERFLREAWSLAERLDVGWLKEEGAEESGPLSAVAETVPPPEPEPERPADPSQKDQLMQQWRHLDEEQPPADVLAGPEPASEPEIEGLERHPQLAELGLSAGQAGRLTSVGVTTIEGLLQMDTLELGNLLSLAFTRAQRVQLLARRVQANTPEPVQRDQTAETLSSVSIAAARRRAAAGPGSEPQSRRPGDALDAAGPFA